ncbi:unnamed protein product [Effrenium voratum]|nr:unnamed protein product [Effrenium voratum]
MVHRSDARLDLPHDWKVSVVCTFISVDTTECGEEDTECCGVRARRSTSVPPTGTTPEDTEFAQNNDVAKADESVSCATDVLDDEASELSSCGSIPGELNVQDDCSKQRQFECGHSYDEGALPEWPVPKYTCVMTCVMNDWLGQSLDLYMQVSRFGETRLVFERQRRG